MSTWQHFSKVVGQGPGRRLGGISFLSRKVRVEHGRMSGVEERHFMRETDVSFRQFAWNCVWSIGRATRLRCSSYCWESVWLTLPSSFWEESLPMTSLLTSLTSYRFWRLAEGWYSKNSCQKVAHSRACMNTTSHYIFLWYIYLYRYTRSNQCNPIHVSQSPTTFKHPLTHDNWIAAPYQSYPPAEIVRG